LKEWPNSHTYSHKFAIPFRETIVPLIAKSVGITITEGQYGLFCGLHKDKAESLRKWIEEQGERVFLRDRLDLSIALANYLAPGGGLTRIGQLEQAAKQDRDIDAAQELAKIVQNVARKTPFFDDADLITCVPPRKGKNFDLPTFIAKRVSNRIEKEFFEAGSWLGEKGQLKEATLSEKWAQLEAASFQANIVDLKDKRVILIDDLYQSGCTLHFIASALKSKGAKRVYGLSIVKSGRNTDNQ
jgi:phosphoribosylpyrophosphate synthetase